MSCATAPLQPDRIHPSLWRATELAGSQHTCLSSGHGALDTELPGHGWPTGSLTELLIAQPGIGELRLLRPVLAGLDRQRPIVMLQPPHPPNSVCCTSRAPNERAWLWLAPQRSQDAPWAAEQILRNGCCAALLYWQTDIRAATLRRLHLAAQSSDTLFFMLRPARAANQSSPAPLRLHLTPAPAGLHIDIIKRRGPSLNETLLIDLPTPAPLVTQHAPLDRRTPARTRAGRPAPAMAR
ncbi:MAG: translesion DNA synthesis-associated protein ImuA [Burkholderiaceae bacterium]